MAEPYFPGKRKDYAEVPWSFGAGGTGIFIRWTDTKPSAAPKKPAVSLGYWLVREEASVHSRGSTGCQLYLTLHVEALKGDAFRLHVAEASMDASVSVNPKRSFGTLDEIAPVWDAYRTHGDAEAFAKTQVMVDGSDWSTRFTGLRCKNVRHELHHVSDNQRACQDLLDNFMDEVRKVERLKGRKPRQKLDRVIEALFGRAGFPSYETDSAAHKLVALDDVYFMLAWYQKHRLKQDPSDRRLSKAFMDGVWNETLHTAMQDLGEVYPWT